MSLLSLLTDSCVIQKRTVTRGKVDAESWKPQPPTRCRVLKRERSAASLEKTQHATRIKTVFVLPSNAKVSVRDRIAHEGRVYEVIEVTQSRDANSIHHLNAICDGVV